MNKQLQIAIGKLIGKDYINTVLSTGEELYTDVPTLQDVLLAISKKLNGNFGTLATNGWLHVPKKDGGQDRLFIDLTKSIFNQTDEVKQQLLELMS